MAYYAYKDLCYRIPERITESIEGFEGDPNYDGDYWTAAAMWVDELLAEIEALKAENAKLKGTTPTEAPHEE
jgi:hypothetical protein